LYLESESPWDKRSHQISRLTRLIVVPITCGHRECDLNGEETRVREREGVREWKGAREINEKERRLSTKEEKEKESSDYG
jgi:hypothetical protein